MTDPLPNLTPGERDDNSEPDMAAICGNCGLNYGQHIGFRCPTGNTTFCDPVRAPTDTGWRMLEVGKDTVESTDVAETMRRDGVWSDWGDMAHSWAGETTWPNDIRFRRRLPSPQPVVSAETPTPRCDAHAHEEGIFSSSKMARHWSKFARTLERELIASQRALLSAEGERDALRTELSALRVMSSQPDNTQAKKL